MANEILLGLGAFYINESLIGLTRGGGSVEITPEWRNIQADGDRGAVKGRVVKDGIECKLTINVLELLKDDFQLMYPALTSTTGVGKTTFTGADAIADTDYVTVKWVGQTKSGKEAIIELKNALNLDPLSWTLAEKDEVVATLTYTAHFDADQSVEPWSISFAD